jgi:hypothetical protein
MDQELRFAVEMWGPNGSLTRVIARSSSIVVARAAFDSAVAEYADASRPVDLFSSSVLFPGQ